jgi:hypothetical protein
MKRFTEIKFDHAFRSLMSASVVVAAVVTLSGCKPERALTGPWEYAELSATISQQATARFGSFARQPTEQTKSEMFFETGEKTISGSSYQEILQKLGVKKPRQDCSTAILNHLDKDGWELVTHTCVFDNESMVIPDGDIGANLSEFTIDRHTWTLRRAR